FENPRLYDVLQHHHIEVVSLLIPAQKPVDVTAPVHEPRRGPRSRRRPLSATQHHPTTSLVGISWHSHPLSRSMSIILTTFCHQNPLHFNYLQTYFYFNDLQERQQNQIVINKEYFAMIFDKLTEVLE